MHAVWVADCGNSSYLLPSTYHIPLPTTYLATACLHVETWDAESLIPTTLAEMPAPV